MLKLSHIPIARPGRDKTKCLPFAMPRHFWFEATLFALCQDSGAKTVNCITPQNVNPVLLREREPKKAKVYRCFTLGPDFTFQRLENNDHEADCYSPFHQPWIGRKKVHTPSCHRRCASAEPPTFFVRKDIPSVGHSHEQKHWQHPGGGAHNTTLTTLNRVCWGQACCRANRYVQGTTQHVQVWSEKSFLSFVEKFLGYNL